MIEVPSEQVAPVASEPEVRREGGARRVLGLVLRIVAPIVSILALWYLAIYFSALPAFVIPRPERVLQTLVQRPLVHHRPPGRDPEGGDDRLSSSRTSSGSGWRCCSWRSRSASS